MATGIRLRTSPATAGQAWPVHSTLGLRAWGVLCVRYCPCDVLEMSEEINAKGYHPPRAKNPDQCVACRLCELLCPEFCIYVVEDEANQTGGG